MKTLVESANKFLSEDDGFSNHDILNVHMWVYKNGGYGFEIKAEAMKGKVFTIKNDKIIYNDNEARIELIQKIADALDIGIKIIE